MDEWEILSLIGFDRGFDLSISYIKSCRGWI
jgi:hypothetical protein